MGLLLASCGSPNVNINADVGSVTTVSQTESTVTEAIQTQSKSTEAITLPEDTVITQTEKQAQTDYAATKTVEKTEKQIVTQKTQGATKTKTAASKKAHAHKYSAATCTSPKKCSCGATIGTALGHSYSAATCTSPKKCTRCGKTSGSALGHNYVNNKCTRCGKTDPDSLPVGLEKLTVVVPNDEFEYKDIIKDSYGNTYYGGFTCDTMYTPTVIFDLDNKYRTFSGSIVVTEDALNGSVHYVEIFADDVLVFSKSKLNRVSRKIDFSINVKNGSLLKIKVGCSNGQGSCLRHEVAIVNAKLTK